MRSIAISLAGVALLAACGGRPPAESHTITGIVTAPRCYGGYDIAGASIQVRDENNRLIGIGTTTSELLFPELVSDLPPAKGCRIVFFVDVPDARFYSLKIGTHNAPAYSKAELATRSWRIALNLD